MHVVTRRSVGSLLGLAAVVLISVLFSGLAIADQSSGHEVQVSGQATSSCPESISQRYPWIACRTTAEGARVIAGPAGSVTWENSRVLQGDDPFVNGGGYFGPIRSPM